MRVRFFQLVTGDHDEMVKETIGDLILQDGQISVDPPDQLFLLRMLKQPLEETDLKTGEIITYNAEAQPKAFLDACLRLFHGTYFWCRTVVPS